MQSTMPDLAARGELICPACGAQQPLADACRRCRADLTLWRRTVVAWAGARSRCLSAVASGKYGQALAAAKELQAIAPTTEANRLVALCSLLAGDYARAIEAHGAAG